MPLISGARLGPYEVLSSLGAGGMGEVYRARDTRLNRVVALKVLPDAFATDTDRRTRFEREAKTLATLNHPHIAQIYGLEESGDAFALAMELVEGEDLATRVRRGPIPYEEARGIALQIADALETAHEHGIIHRDLKPSNIALTVDGQVKVLDFGLAKLQPSGSGGAELLDSPTITSPAMTQAGLILGTAAYMSPEQAKGKPVDKRTDVWAFGCVLYEMLTGKRAFDGEDVLDTLGAITRGDVDWAALPNDVPDTIRTLLRRCLERDRRERVSDIAVARYELRERAAQPVVTAKPSASARAWKAITFIFALASLALTVVVAGWWRPTAPDKITRFSLHPPPGRPFMSFPHLLAVSPDGGRIAFIATHPTAGNQLWIQSLDSLEPQLVGGTDDASHPFWSRDGRSIGFLTATNLMRVDLAGGPPRILADRVARPGGQRTGLSLGSGVGAWSSENVILVGSAGQGLWQVAASGGEPKSVTELDLSRNELGHNWPTFIPDGRRFLYRVASTLPEHSGIYLGSLDDPSEKRRLLDVNSSMAYAPPGYLVYVHDQTLVARPFDAGKGEFTGDPTPIAEHVDVNPQNGGAAFAVSANGVLAYRTAADDGGDGELAWFDRAGRHLATVGSNAYGYPRLSPDGMRLAAAHRTEAMSPSPWDLWLIDLARGVPSRLTFDEDANETDPVWSPDGSHIVYSSWRERRYTLLRKPWDGSGAEEKLLDYNDLIWPRDWSHDGKYLLLAAMNVGGKSTGVDIAALPLTSDRRTLMPLVQTPFNEPNPRFSPDARWIAYQSDESGTNEIYIRAFPSTGPKWRISTSGGMRPVWRGDGQELFYLTRDGRRLMTVAIRTTGASLVPGVPRELFGTRVRLGAAGRYDVSRDGQRFLLPIAREAPTTPITVVLNWTAALKGKG